MTHEDIPELDPELAKVIAQVRQGRPVPPSLRGNLETRLASILVPGLPDVGPTSPARAAMTAPRLAWGAVARGIGLFAAGSAVGAGVHARVPKATVEIRYVDRIVVVGPDAAPSTPVPPPAPVPEAAPLAPRPAPTQETERDTDLTRELALIDTAQSALGRGEPQVALLSLDKHAKAFPKGRLSEQREALAIQALVRTGQGGQARARASRFAQQYPRSLFLPVVKAALETIP